MEIIMGAILEGKVSGITKFGAFVTFPDGSSGLVHISEIANTYVNDVHDYLTIGQEVRVKVLSITPEGKVNLSVKQALPPEERAVQGERRPYTPRAREAGGHHPAQNRDGFQQRGGYTQKSPAQRSPVSKQAAPDYLPPDQGGVHGPTADAGFEEKLKHYMQDSESKMSGNKLYAERKSGNRRRK